MLDKGRLKRKERFYTYRNSLGVLGDGTTADIGAGVGAPVEGEAGATGIVGAIMTAGDEYDFWVPVPRDLNWSHDVGIRVVYSTASTTGSDTHTWIVLYDVIAAGTAWAVGSTALDTTIAVDTDNGTADAHQLTDRGVINGDTVTMAQVTEPAFWALNVKLDATDAAEEINLFGLLVDYVPKRAMGEPQSWNPGRDQELH